MGSGSLFFMKWLYSIDAEKIPSAGFDERPKHATFADTLRLEIASQFG